ncbi:hypothetical protein JTF06_12555 [Desemzia sp. RIT804]|uniref:hypothetical protein n=1 Tax=Desemzia sp. RIT 804 TaxID=2810209 RepID=UPI001951C8A9|nr:hypothetical protein [Desemzia sp. RIT 804]MBM6615716.1 hypothetical protein [Desemzia sp. RIT 804]
MQNKIELLQQYIDQAEIFLEVLELVQKAAFPITHSQEGGYTKMEQNHLDPKVIMSKRFMLNHPEEFLNFERTMTSLLFLSQTQDIFI